MNFFLKVFESLSRMNVTVQVQYVSRCPTEFDERRVPSGDTVRASSTAPGLPPLPYQKSPKYFCQLPSEDQADQV
jgi:hypothetical protein